MILSFRTARVFSLLLSILGLVYGSQPRASAATSSVTTLVPGVLTVCLFPTFPPFDSESHGVWSGWDWDFMAGFARSQHLRIRGVRVKDYAEIWLRPGQNRCDIAASGIADLELRRRQTGSLAIWSSHYYRMARDFGVKTADAGSLRDVTDLRGRRVMVIAQSTADIDITNRVALAHVPNVTIMRTDNDEANAEAVRDGTGSDAPFAFGSGYGTVADLAQRLGGLVAVWPHCVMLADGRETTESFSFVTRAASTGLAPALDAYIAHPAQAYEGGTGRSCKSYPNH